MSDQYYRKDRTKTTALGVVRKYWKNKRLRVMVLLIVPALSFMMFSNKGVIQRLKLESAKREMLEKVSQAQKEQAELQTLSKALNNDPKMIEKVAREKYGMIREGETIYKVKKEK